MNVGIGPASLEAHQKEGKTLPSVSASPQGGEFSSEELEVTLSVLQAESGAYTIAFTWCPILGYAWIPKSITCPFLF